MSTTPPRRPGLRLQITCIGLDLELSPAALFSLAAVVSALVLSASEQDLIIRAGPFSMEWRQVRSVAAAAVGPPEESADHPRAAQRGTPLAHVPTHESR